MIKVQEWERHHEQPFINLA